MIYNQVEYSIKMANDFKSNVAWFTTLCIYLLPTQSSIYLTTYLLPTHPPTHPLTYPLFPYLHTYLFTYTFFTYLFM
jgi:hypothetical protein